MALLIKNRVPCDDDTRSLPHPLRSFCRPYALAWAANHDRVTAYDLHLIVFPCVAIGYCDLRSYNGFRLTTFVMRHSYGSYTRLRHALSVFLGLSCHLCCSVAFCGYTLRYLWFRLAKYGKPPCKGFRAAK